tara:strand:+ start:68079 stop:68399 length:321 start_codon:yes stop_codon:yes gene_type:complete
MDISRRASKNDHGSRKTHAQFDKLSVRKNQIKIESKEVENFSPGTKHNYVFTLSFDEFNNLIRTVAEEALKQPSVIEDAISPILKELMILQTVGSGSYKASNIPET